MSRYFVLVILSLLICYPHILWAGGTRSSAHRSTSHSASLGHTSYHRSAAPTGSTSRTTTHSSTANKQPVTSKAYRPGVTHSAAIAEADRQRAEQATAAKKAADKKKADEAKKKAEMNTVKPMPGQKAKTAKPIGPIHSL